MTPPNALAAELAAHEDFVRRTLRGLLRDENDLQDVVQETWIRALKRPRSEATSPGWLAQTAKNIAISRWRSDRRRSRREQARDASREVESPEQALQRVEDRTRVTSTIVELAEPYRSVILMRYEQGLSVRSIAERTGASASTVRSQLSRAHGMLRSRLDHQFGDRRQWAALAAPGAAAVGGGATQATTLALAAGTAAAVLAVGAWQLAPVAPRKSESMPSAATGTVERLATVANPTEGGNAMLAGQDDARTTARVAARPARTHLALRPAELVDRSFGLDYELATYSFLRGIRDDPTSMLVQNDWELQLSNGDFVVNTVTDDRSSIADLTAVGPYEIGAALDWNIRFHTGSVPVVEGHTYVIRTRDGDSDLMTVAHVTSLEPGRRCVLDWLSTDGTGRSQGSLRNEHTGDQNLVDVLTQFRSISSAESPLEEPVARLQARSGAIGGNPLQIDLSGAHSSRFRNVATEPLDVDTEVDSNEKSTSYWEGGNVPSGKVFVVESAAYRGWAKGDSNGGGEFVVTVGGNTLFTSESTPDPILGEWRGEIRIRPGDEADTNLTISNSSAAELVLTGRFEDEVTVEGEAWAPNPGFYENVQEQVSNELRKRHVRLSGTDLVLQLRSGARSWSSRLSLNGKTESIEVVRDAPIDFEKPRDPNVDSEAYFIGGQIGAGRTFVVTQVDYDIQREGDLERRCPIELCVSGLHLVETREAPKQVKGRWQGRLILRPGEETRTFLKVGQNCSADVQLRGFLR